MMASSLPAQCDKPFVDLVFDEHDPSVWGLGCQDNRTLNLYVLDLTTQWSLVQKLGLRHEHQALIVSLHEDKILAMNHGQDLNSKNLAKFVRAFHEDPDALKLLKLSSTTSEQSDATSIEEINADNFANKLLSVRTEPGKFLSVTAPFSFSSIAATTKQNQCEAMNLADRN